MVLLFWLNTDWYRIQAFITSQPMFHLIMLFSILLAFHHIKNWLVLDILKTLRFSLSKWPSHQNTEPRCLISLCLTRLCHHQPLVNNSRQVTVLAVSEHDGWAPFTAVIVLTTWLNTILAPYQGELPTKDTTCFWVLLAACFQDNTAIQNQQPVTLSGK